MGDNNSTFSDHLAETATEPNYGDDRDFVQQKAVIDALRAGDLARAEQAISSYAGLINSPLATLDPEGLSLLDFLFSRPMQSYPNTAFSSKIASMLTKQGVGLREDILLNMVENGYIEFAPHLLLTQKQDNRTKLLGYSRPDEHKCALHLAGKNENTSVFWCFAGFENILYERLSRNLTSNPSRLTSSQLRSECADAKNLFPGDVHAAIIYLLIQSNAIEKYPDILIHAIKHATTKALTHVLPNELGGSFPVLIMRRGAAHLEATYRILTTYFNSLNLSKGEDPFTNSKQESSSSSDAKSFTIEQADEISLAAYQLKDYKIMNLVTKHTGIKFDWMLDDTLPFSMEQREHLVRLNTGLSYKNLSREQRLALSEKAVQILRAKIDVKKSYQELQALLFAQQSIANDLLVLGLHTNTLDYIATRLTQFIAGIDYQLSQIEGNDDLPLQLRQERQAYSTTKQYFLLRLQNHYQMQQGKTADSLIVTRQIADKQAELKAKEAYLSSIDNPIIAQPSPGS